MARKYDISDEEEARIQAGIARDPDASELTDYELANMRPASEALPAALYEALTRRGRPKAAVVKQAVKLRLDPEIVAVFRATGPGWQTKMNDVLAGAAVGLDVRHRDKNGEISKKHGNTEIKTLRKIYGESFATGFKLSDRLSAVLKATNEPSLSQLRKHYDDGTLEKKIKEAAK